MRERRLLVVLIVAATAAVGCASAPPRAGADRSFVWAHLANTGPAADGPSYAIVPGDLLNIQVWEQ